MNVEIVSQEKNMVEVKIDNPTFAEILRVYLAENGSDYAAWRREHPSKPVVLKIQANSGTVSKAISDAVASIEKDCDKLLALVKK